MNVCSRFRKLIFPRVAGQGEREVNQSRKHNEFETEDNDGSYLLDKLVKTEPRTQSLRFNCKLCFERPFDQARENQLNNFDKTFVDFSVVVTINESHTQPCSDCYCFIFALNLFFLFKTIKCFPLPLANIVLLKIYYT